MNCIHADNLRTCVQREYWYQTALGGLRQRGQGVQEHVEGASVEGASVEGASVEGASAPERETPPFTIKTNTAGIKTNRY